jgi:hypothetical protein
LDSFEGEITKLQNNEELLKKKYQGELDKLQKENEENAAKANAWDDENSLINSINPLHDLAKFVKKLFTLSIVCGGLFLGFKILEVFFPALSILSGIAGMALNVLKKIVPKAFEFAGLASSKVVDTLGQVLRSNQNFMQKLRDIPLEAELIKNYPADYKFTKDEVQGLLEQLTENTLDEMKKEYEKNTDTESRGYISLVKAKEGIKDEKIVTSLI